MRGPKSAPKTDQEWESQKPDFHQLYVIENLTLDVVMRRMEEEHHFEASRKQYNKMITAWHMDKNIKSHEMHAIIRKDLKRKAEGPPKESEFRVNGHLVGSNKILRFTKEKSKEQLYEVMAETGKDPGFSKADPQLIIF